MPLWSQLHTAQLYVVDSSRQGNNAGVPPDVNYEDHFGKHSGI